MNDFVDPFARLASAAGKVVADGWTAAMLGIWNAGLWLLRLAETFLDSLLTPDLSETGPGAWLYRVMFWIAGALLLIMALVQLCLLYTSPSPRDRLLSRLPSSAR